MNEVGGAIAELIELPMRNELADTVVVGGFLTTRLRRAELAALTVRDCTANSKEQITDPKLVFSSNCQGISLARTDRTFVDAMSQGDLIHADGMSAVIVSRLLTNRPLPERICATDFSTTPRVRRLQQNFPFFFWVALRRKTKPSARQYKASIRIAGRHHGFVDDQEGRAACAPRLWQAGLTLLWVAMEKPKQERWCVRNRSDWRASAG